MNLKTKEDNVEVTEEDNKNNENKSPKKLSSVERSLVIIKPDGVAKKVVGEIISRFEKAGLEIDRIRVLNMDKSIALTHYQEHKGKPYFEKLINYMISGPSIVMVVKGENAISKTRELMGPTDPSKASKGTIRGDFGTDITINVIHGSDCSENAEREINIFFRNYLWKEEAA